MAVASALPPVEATRRHLNVRQAQTVQRVIDAARDELREVGFDDLTVRSVASRAGVATATAYTYFSSKSHLLAEILWRMLNARDRIESTLPNPGARVAAVFTDLSRFLAADPELARAATTALLDPDPDVAQLRWLIAAEINSRIVRAAGPQATADVVDALGIAWSGAMLQAGMGHTDYTQMGERLVAVTRLILGGDQ
ncbi:MAG TPA: TetR/AcrR family transcriptional regulator [Jatrophihabitantaceae bacterium]